MRTPPRSETLNSVGYRQPRERENKKLPPETLDDSIQLSHGIRDYRGGVILNTLSSLPTSYFNIEASVNGQQSAFRQQTKESVFIIPR